MRVHSRRAKLNWTKLRFATGSQSSPWRWRAWAVVKLPNKRWWIPIGARPEGPRAEVGFTTADHGLSSIQCTVWLLWLLWLLNSVWRLQHLSTPSMDKCNDKITVKDYIFTKHHAQRKILKYILCRVVDPHKKVPDLNCEVQDLLLEVVDLK